MSKLYCNIYNGLGNQLFNYALGLYLSKKYNRKLVLNLTKLNSINFLAKIGLKKDTIRDFELDKIGFDDPVEQYKFLSLLRKFSWINNSKRIFTDFRRTHNESNLEISDKDIYCTGWGDFKIVSEILPQMREKFNPRFEISKNVEKIKSLILSSNSVAIHFRRTDFLDPKISSYAMGLSTDVYYTNAVNYMNTHVENPLFIIFSDDPSYTKENNVLENSFIVTGNNGSEDFYLMSLCKHFIVANSTYSFWAAILNKQKNKLVCTPEYWYNSPLRQADFVPEDWIQIAI